MPRRVRSRTPTRGGDGRRIVLTSSRLRRHPTTPTEAIPLAITVGADDTLYALDKTTLLAYVPPYTEITPTAVLPLASASNGGLIIDSAGGAYLSAARAGGAPGGDSVARIAYYAGPLATPATSPGSTIDQAARPPSRRHSAPTSSRSPRPAPPAWVLPKMRRETCSRSTAAGA